MKRKTATVLIVMVVIMVLVWVGYLLVSNFDIVEIIRKIHGG